MTRTINATVAFFLWLAVIDSVPSTQAQEAPSQDALVQLPTSVSTLTVVCALPEKQRGADINGRPEFQTQRLAARGGRVEITVSTEPVWIIEGELPAQTSVSGDASPFGFHPALAPGFGFDFAENIGVRWHRPGLYLMWVLGQPDLSSDNYTWELSDRDVMAVPPGMRQMRNLCVCHDGMVQIAKRPLLEAAKRPKIDVSEHVEGTTYRPKDVVKYQRWVRAVVERYEQAVRIYAAPSLEKYVALDAKRPPNPCILLKPIRIPAEEGEEGTVPMMPARLCDEFPEITVPLEPYTTDFAGVLAQILRPNAGYSLDAPDIAYIGGDPMLIQNPHDPISDECGKPMRFLFQFGEIVPGVQMADAGVFYVYGCDDHPDCCKGFVDSH